MPGQVAGGVQTIANEGASGSCETRANTRCPFSSSYLGLTGQAGPAKPPSSTRPQTIAPMLPARRDAPTTATDFGRNKASRLRTVTASPQVMPRMTRR